MQLADQSLQDESCPVQRCAGEDMLCHTAESSTMYPVLVQEAFGAVAHLTSVVTHHKLVPRSVLGFADQAGEAERVSVWLAASVRVCDL